MYQERIPFVSKMKEVEQVDSTKVDTKEENKLEFFMDVGNPISKHS